MHPEVRAIADRFMYEQATLKHITALLAEDDLQRPLDHPALSDVGLLLQHLAFGFLGFADAWAGWLRGASGFRLGTRPCDLAAHALVANRPRPGTDQAQLRELFGRGLNALVATLASTPDGREHDGTDRGQALEVLRELGGHNLAHAIPLIDAVPEVRFDPLVLNWLLHAEFEDDASRDWQAKLLADAREYLASHPYEEEEDEE